MSPFKKPQWKWLLVIPIFAVSESLCLLSYDVCLDSVVFHVWVHWQTNMALGQSTLIIDLVSGTNHKTEEVLVLPKKWFYKSVDGHDEVLAVVRHLPRLWHRQDGAPHVLAVGDLAAGADGQLGRSRADRSWVAAVGGRGCCGSCHFRVGDSCVVVGAARWGVEELVGVARGRGLGRGWVEKHGHRGDLGGVASKVSGFGSDLR